MRTAPLLLLLLCFSALNAQNKPGKTPKPPANGDNIVPNGGFELLNGTPIGWSYNGAYFGQTVKYWFSATTASPDVYTPKTTVPTDWAAKGFGKQSARTGKNMAGLTLYGCVNGKPHCREYVEIQLAEPLVIGQTYQVEFWVTTLDRSLHINNLGAYFSVSPIERKTDELLLRTAQVEVSSVVSPGKKGQWMRVSGTFKAAYEAEYILIGNFNDDSNTHTVTHRDDCYNYAYYYLDDVSVKKVPPYNPVPVKPDDLTRQPLEVGKTIALKNIYFAFDKDELMPRSYVELHKLLTIMRANPTMQIEIQGHTDSDGDDSYNIDLSNRRALAVVTYLISNGIGAPRLRSKGFGENQPVATNETDEGRAQNRRVEFLILKK